MVTGPINKDEIIPLKRNPWVDNFFRPLLITIMIMCFNISVVNLVRVVFPAWHGAYFLLGMLLTTVEAMYSYRVLKHWRSRGVSVMRYRLTEWGLLIVGLKILSLAGKSAAQIWAELQGLWQDPLNNLLNIEFYVFLTLAFLSWMIATNTSDDFEALHDPWLFHTDNRLPLDDLAQRFFWGGIFLVIISGVTQWGVYASFESLTDFRRPSLGGIILNVLVYFTLGLALLSQARLTTLLVRWHVQKITVSAGLVKQWAKYGLLFLGLVGVVVFFLPTRYTLGFLTTAGIIVGFGLNSLVFIFQLLLFLLYLPFLWLSSLFGEPPPEAAPPAPPPPPGLAAARPDAPPIPWVEALQSLAFWLVALAIIGFLVKFYLDDHPEIGQLLKSFRPVALALKLWQGLWARLLGLVRAGVKLIPKKVDSLPTRAEAPRQARGWNWFGLRGLPPRQRILSYYLNILNRAAEKGPGRHPHQTPYEYEPDLSRAVPQVDEEIDALTQVFVEARYSRQSFDDAQANRVKQQWQQIRRALRGRMKK